MAFDRKVLIKKKNLETQNVSLQAYGKHSYPSLKYATALVLCLICTVSEAPTLANIKEEPQLKGSRQQQQV